MTTSRVSQARREREIETFLKGVEVADMFRVDPKTVTRWAQTGRIPRAAWILTPGGHRRYKESYVNTLLEEDVTDLDIEP